MANISAVIPSYNGLELLKKHLPAVVGSLPKGSQLIISDDASTDNTVDWLISQYKLVKTTFIPEIFPKKYYPTLNHIDLEMYRSKETERAKLDVVLLHNKRNLRFGGAANLGVLFADHEFVFLLNNDVSPQENAARVLLEKIQGDSAIFSVTPHEFESDQDNEPSGKNKLWFARGLYQHAKADDFTAGPTAWASGGGSIFRKSMWLQLKGFDQRFYPAYWEDIDLSFRAQKKGWQVLFEPSAKVIHKHETTHQSVWHQQQLNNISWNNADKFTVKHADFWQLIAFVLWRPYWWWQRHQASAVQDV